MEEKIEDFEGCVGCFIFFVIFSVIVSVGGWLYDVSGLEEWCTQRVEQREAEQRILEVLDDGTERSYYYLRDKTMLSPQVLEDALLTLEKRKRIKHNRQELHLRKYYIVR